MLQERIGTCEAQSLPILMSSSILSELVAITSVGDDIYKHRPVEKPLYYIIKTHIGSINHVHALKMHVDPF